MKISIKREQNNACFGSAEREKFGAKLKTLKNLIWMAALALTAATWSGCSNEEEPTAAEQPAQPAQPRTYTVTTTLSPRDGETRSTMTDNDDGSISAEWEVDDEIWVLYASTISDTEETTAEVIAVDPSTKAATIRLTLTDPKDGGAISFGYPANFFNNPKDPCNDQTGTLDDINANFAAISGTGELTVSDSGVTLPDVTMMPAMCIWKFSFTDGTDDITSAVTKLVIDFPNNGMTYTVTPTSLSNIYVALYGDVINAQPICITAVTATGFYRKAAASVTLDAGLTYTSTDLALKKAEVGKVFGADGGIYDNAAATPGGNTAVAMIAYVGSETGESAYNFTHGLALAMSDASGNSIRVWSTSTSSTVHSYTPYGSNAFSSKSESGLQYNDETHDSDTYPPFKAAMANNSTAAPTGCSAWFLPTGYQWNQMINACKNVLGTKNDQRDLRDGFKSRGGTNLKADDYWSSTELSAEYAWYYSFYYGNWREGHKSKGCYVRSGLAF